ncbi:NAD-dependent succinate-semialdehyde dehydrogenase [Virgibacillus sp. C22-A2]|uniref:NAD-dependent succinate-semialdehyde dehydrogenase n=1 Tax=Virgibacillus tibetensis TaxID=3042313 RepID=A0ABU6KDV7_9BACI|nr:NAD-dependent succinate-semialdehyde dehydrogenase [Virgibacillus sp. C22-A2]
MLTVKNPATGEIAYEVPYGNQEHVNQAIQAATDAFSKWSKTTALERSNFLAAVAGKMKDNKEFLASVITKEMGKTISDARGEVQMAADYFQWFSEQAKRVYGETVPANDVSKRTMVIKKPVGVVGAITPWNFPVAMVARKVAPALAAGCTVVLKPASQSPQSAIELCKLFDEVGIPAGVLNVVTAKSSMVSDVMMNSQAIRKITFTGSTEVGKQLLEGAAKTVKHVSMELGGHAPFIVFDDADIDDAIDGVLKSKYRCSGQMCTATNRIHVQSSIAELFSQKLADRVSSLHVGNGINEESEVGPLVDQQAIAKVEAQVADAVQKGASILTGGKRLSENEFAKGNFFAPTVLKNVNQDMNIYTEETFGPVAPIITFENEEELLLQVNHAEYGLASYMYTNDMSRIIRMTDALEYGMVGVNDPLPFTVQAPFGGTKESGVGKEGGHQGIDEYLEEKMISIRFKNTVPTN